MHCTLSRCVGIDGLMVSADGTQPCADRVEREVREATGGLASDGVNRQAPKQEHSHR